MGFCGVLPAHVWHRVGDGICPGTTAADQRRAELAKAAFAAKHLSDRQYLHAVAARNRQHMTPDVAAYLAGITCRAADTDRRWGV